MTHKSLTSQRKHAEKHDIDMCIVCLNKKLGHLRVFKAIIQKGHYWIRNLVV